jgi:5-methylcytosine-specific restriction protein A
MPTTRNPTWERDELILALDLYFQYKPTTISETQPRIIELSEILNQLPIHTDRPDRASFRNPNGVYMKLCNFLALDSSYHGKGLERGDLREQEV